MQGCDAEMINTACGDRSNMQLHPAALQPGAGDPAHWNPNRDLHLELYHPLGTNARQKPTEDDAGQPMAHEKTRNRDKPCCERKVSLVKHVLVVIGLLLLMVCLLGIIIKMWMRTKDLQSNKSYLQKGSGCLVPEIKHMKSKHVMKPICPGDGNTCVLQCMPGYIGDPVVWFCDSESKTWQKGGSESSSESGSDEPSTHSDFGSYSDSSESLTVPTCTKMVKPEMEKPKCDSSESQEHAQEVPDPQDGKAPKKSNNDENSSVEAPKNSKNDENTETETGNNSDHCLVEDLQKYTLLGLSVGCVSDGNCWLRCPPGITQTAGQSSQMLCKNGRWKPEGVDPAEITCGDLERCVIKAGHEDEDKKKSSIEVHPENTPISGSQHIDVTSVQCGQADGEDQSIPWELNIPFAAQHQKACTAKCQEGHVLVDMYAKLPPAENGLELDCVPVSVGNAFRLAFRPKKGYYCSSGVTMNQVTQQAGNIAGKVADVATDVAGKVGVQAQGIAKQIAGHVVKKIKEADQETE